MVQIKPKPRPLNILIACEESGVARTAFEGMGNNVWSCDLLPSRIPGHHIQEDVRVVLREARWDLMIAFPPCTYLANSGVKHMYKGGRKENGFDEERVINMIEAAHLFQLLADYPDVPFIAVENPIMHGHALQFVGRRATQFIQPWQFGHGETKATGLWLKNLPKLRPTNIVEGREARVHKMGPSPTRQRDRSVTYEGIAKAMAAQWEPFVYNKLFG